MRRMEPQIYEFGGFRIEVEKRVLLRNGKPLALTPKVFDTLLYLVQGRGEVLEKEALMRVVWPDTVVEENNLNQNISTLRRVLGEKRGENLYISTVPGKGYRFAASVRSGNAGANRTRRRARGTTLAVLPFANLDASPERDYLADGLTEETIITLGHIDPDQIRVIGRTSIMRYKQPGKSLGEIGRELGANYLVESSVRSEGGRVRIASSLIRVRDQVQIWSACFDSEPSSMLAFQRELSIAIAEQIRLRLSPERLTAMERRQTQDAEAYDLYLHGRYFWNQLTALTTRRAIEYFERATELDPEYALAWSGIADAYAAGPVTGDACPQVVWPRAQQAVKRAVEAECELPETQTSLGFLKFWLDWDWPASEAAYRKAILLDPNYPLAHRMLGIVLSHMGRHEESRLAMQRARELDPFYAMHHALSSQVAFAARDYAAAVRFAQQAVIVDPEFWIGQWQLAQAYAQVGEHALALETLKKAGQLSGGNTKVMSLRGYLFARMGKPEEAREVLQTLGSIGRERYVPPYALALVHAGLEEFDSAFTWLERAYEARDVHLIFLPIDPKWDPLRGETRFTSLLRLCGFPSPAISRDERP